VLRTATSSLIPVEGVFALVGFTLLTSLPVVMGGSLFVAILLTLIRCYRDSEMVVWFSSGLSLTAWVRPVLTFVLPSVLVIAALTFFVYPWAARVGAVPAPARIAGRGRAGAGRRVPGVQARGLGVFRGGWIRIGYRRNARPRAARRTEHMIALAG
jgi:lipopolysaccharide export system permease protein